MTRRSLAIKRYGTKNIEKGNPTEHMLTGTSVNISAIVAKKLWKAQ